MDALSLAVGAALGFVIGAMGASLVWRGWWHKEFVKDWYRKNQLPEPPPLARGQRRTMHD